MNKESAIQKIITGRGENRRLDRRYVFFGLFLFIMVATISFLWTRNMPETNAVDLSGFKAGNIMSDAVMRNYTSMTEAEIQTFLNSKNKCNRVYESAKKASYGLAGNAVNYYSEKSPYTWHVSNTTKGTFKCLNNEKVGGETPAHIIYQASQDYKINPQVLIVLLEKEQALVTDTYPHSIQYRSATGYGCPDTAACSSKYYGLKNQIRNAAALFDEVLSGGWSTYPVGSNTIRYSPKASCGSSKVYIENRATSALYRYTPYQPNAAALKAGTGTATCGAYGNRNFYIYFTEWFGSTQKVTPKTASVNFNTNDVFTLKTSDGKYLVPETEKSGSKLIASADAAEEAREYQFVKNGEFYVLVHKKSGLAIDLKNADLDAGEIQVYTVDGTEAQNWRISASGSGFIIHSAMLDQYVLDTSDGISLEFYDTAKKTEVFEIADVSEAIIEDGTYLLETTGGKAVNLTDNKTADGTALNIAAPTYATAQQFQITRRADGYYTLKNVAANKVIDVKSASTANGAVIQIYTSNDSCAQKWAIKKSNENYQFISSCSDKAIDVTSGAVSTNGAKLQLYTAKENSNSQEFVLRDEAYIKEKAAELAEKAKAEEAAYRTVANGNYTIVSAINKNYVLDVKGASKSNSANVQLYKSNGTKAQKFKVTYNSSKKAYTIINLNSNKALDVKSAKMKNSTNVQQYKSNGTCAQYWRINKNSNGTFTLISTCGNFALDVKGGVAKNSTNVQIYKPNTSKAQRWTFKAV